MSVATEDSQPYRPQTAPPNGRQPASAAPHGRTAAEVRLLFERLRADGDAQAREALIEQFLPLARSLALRYRRSGEPLDDLMQVASVGLIKAVDRFDPAREIAFSSFAVPTILGEVKRHFRDRTWAIRVPRRWQELSLSVDRAVETLADQLNRQPSVAEVAAAVGAGEADVLEALQVGGAYRTVSFELPRAANAGDDGDALLGDSLGVQEDGFERAEDRATLLQLMPKATPRERDVLRMRFVEDMTQARIGGVIGVSQMQVSRIIRDALVHLRVAAELPSGRRLSG